MRARWAETDERIDEVSEELGSWISRRVERRIRKAYPKIQAVEARLANEKVFAAGCGFYKVVMLFFIGAFLGDITETIFCRVTAGVWMSRSSVVWGPFSIVWGLAIALATALLYESKNRSDRFLFLMGPLLGGAYEYLCSVFTELVFGKVFWDYSKIPFNLGGRINLLYCFFWGIAAVVWLKLLCPLMEKWIEKLPVVGGKLPDLGADRFHVLQRGRILRGTGAARPEKQRRGSHQWLAEMGRCALRRCKDGEDLSKCYRDGIDREKFHRNFQKSGRMRSGHSFLVKIPNNLCFPLKCRNVMI